MFLLRCYMHYRDLAQERYRVAPTLPVEACRPVARRPVNLPDLRPEPVDPLALADLPVRVG